MLNLDCNILSQVVSKALADAAAHPRWVNAIKRAFEEVDSNPWIERNPNGHGLIIGSPSGACYSANGECSCPAFAFGRACWHRACARIVRLHDETVQHRELAAAARARQAAEQIVCQQPDNLCEVHNPCPEHAAQAAAYLAADALADKVITVVDQTRVARKIAAARATVALNELFA